MAAFALAAWTALLPAAGLLDVRAHAGSRDSGLFEWQPTLACVATNSRVVLQRAYLPRVTGEPIQVLGRTCLQCRPGLAAPAAPWSDQHRDVLRV
jgi:hypothetical protein